MKRVLLIVVGVLLLLILFVAVTTWLNTRPITEADAVEMMQAVIEKAVDSKDVSSGLVRIVSPEDGFDETFVVGESHGAMTVVDQPFHVASVGKLFTAALAGMLVDEELIAFDDPIVDYFEEGVLDGLFVFEGVDYQNEVTVAMLLGHTSGLADYFEDAGRDGLSGEEWMLAEPDRFWAPDEIVDFTRDSQEAVGPAGEQFHYSDTGFILLGMMIENVTGIRLDEAMETMIFAPLSMDDSYLMFYGEPKNEKRKINEAWVNGVDVSGFESISIDWAGGGVISTLDDLVKFTKAFNEGDLLSEDTLAALYRFDEKFMKGIAYGLGTMEYRFNEFMPTLGFLPKYRGHMGILGTHVLYDPENGTILVASFGSTDFVAGSVRTMIQLATILWRIQ